MDVKLKSECRHYPDWYAVKPKSRRSKSRRRGDGPRYERHRVQLEEIIRAWHEVRRQKQVSGVARVRGATQDVRPILAELDAMLNEKDEPDFLHRPKDYAYDIARKSIKNAYTHYLGSAPSPAVAPDGEGGLIVEWKSGQRVVCLITAPGEDRKSYVYSKGAKSAQVDYDTSGLILAQRLRSIFAD
jgi:hypothetical protein